MPAAIAIPAVMGAVGVGGSLASGFMGSSAAEKASQAQADAAKYAADKQSQAAADSLGFQKQVYGDEKTNVQPYIDAGKTALGSLSTGLRTGGEFNQPYDAGKILQDDPGYQFRMDQGTQAIDRNAAANGGLGSGGTLKALTQYGQDYASNEYGAAYNRFKQNQADRFNRLSSLAGTGQTATQQIGSAGQAAAGNIANVNTNTANLVGQDAMAGANATASGYLGKANAWSGAIGGIGKSLSGAYSLYQQGQNGGGGGGSAPGMDLSQLKSLGIAG